MTLYLPPSVAADRRMEFAAELTRRCDWEDPLAQEWTRKLQAIDPRLMCARARELIPAGTPLVPGYYHILKVNDDAPMSVFAIHIDGAFAEPDSRVYHCLSAGDLHDPRTFRRWRAAEQATEAAHARADARDKEDRREEVRDRVNAATRTQVSLDRTLPWTQNSQGRRAARGR